MHKKKIDEIVECILSDYTQGRDVDRLEPFTRPDKDAVICVIEKLRRIIFPGFFQDNTHKYYNERSHFCVLIEDAMFRMTSQIKLAYISRGLGEGEAMEKAQKATEAFFAEIPHLRAVTQTDLQAAFDGDPAAEDMAEIIFSYPGLFAITVYRMAHALWELKVPMLPRMMTEYAHSVTGIDIHPGATVGKYFFIDHGTGIVIGETTVIGENVKIYQGVTLGALSTRGGQSLRGKRRHPTIEDGVTIYAGASILGGDTVIGKGSVIGSNVFITESIAPGTSVRNKKQELQFKTK